VPPLSLSLPLFAPLPLVPMVPSPPQSARIPNPVAPSVCVSPIPLICAAQPLPAVPMAVPAESFPWSCKPPPRPPPFPIPRSFLQPPAADPGTYTSPPYTLRPSRRPSHAGHRGPEFHTDAAVPRSSPPPSPGSPSSSSPMKGRLSQTRERPRGRVTAPVPVSLLHPPPHLRPSALRANPAPPVAVSLPPQSLPTVQRPGSFAPANHHRRRTTSVPPTPLPRPLHCSPFLMLALISAVP